MQNKVALIANIPAGIPDVRVCKSPICAFQGSVEVDIYQTEDLLLVLAAKSGESDAFDELSRRHCKRIRRRLYGILHNWEDTEDALQDALLNAFRHIGRFRNDSSFSTWLTRIAINSALAVLRKRRMHPDVSFDDTGSSTDRVQAREFPDLSRSPELLCADHEVKELLRIAMLRLPWHFRSVAELYHNEDRSINEMAQTLGISVAATKSRLLRARKALRESLPELRTRY